MLAVTSNPNNTASTVQQLVDFVLSKSDQWDTGHISLALAVVLEFVIIMTLIGDTPLGVELPNIPPPGEAATATLDTSPGAPTDPTATLEPLPTGTPEPETVLVFNEGFEGTFTRKQPLRTGCVEDDPDHFVPADWEPWYEDCTYYFKTPPLFGCNNETQPYPIDGCEGAATANGRPEYERALTDEDANRVLSGRAAAQYFWFLRPGYGGYYRQVNIPQGAQSCTLEAYFQASMFRVPQTNDDFYTIMPSLQVLSAPPLRDGTVIASEEFVSEPNENRWYDKYERLAISFEPQLSQVYIALGARNNFSSQGDMYWDDVSLTCLVNATQAQAPAVQPSPVLTQTPASVPDRRDEQEFLLPTPTPLAVQPTPNGNGVIEVTPLSPNGPEVGLVPNTGNLFLQFDELVNRLSSVSGYTDVRNDGCSYFNVEENVGVRIRAAFDASGNFLAPSITNEQVGFVYGNEQIGVMATYDLAGSAGRWALVYKIEGGQEVGGWSAQFLGTGADIVLFGTLNCADFGSILQ